jgi:hypothetical protein
MADVEQLRFRLRVSAGRKALVDHIGAFFEQLPGAYFVVTSGIDSHHGKFRFTWRPN